MQGGRVFELGEQPNWAGLTSCSPQSNSFVREIMEKPVECLIERGYAIIRLDDDLVDCYSLFHTAWEEFSAFPEEMKVPFAIQQFEQTSNSPNQYHGFSCVQGLKEQFMLRASGVNSDLQTPAEMPECQIHFGKTALRLYEYCDQTCRDYISRVLKHNKISKSNLDRILDPVFVVDGVVEYDEKTGHVYSSYLPEGFISSSIMDNFHYFNFFKENEGIEKAFANNHGSHTDSGLMTLVVCTDEPGLEVLDQKTNEWIALEELLHDYAKQWNESHRKFATIFWGDSCAYLLPNHKGCELVSPTFHRVAQCNKERYSVVFKQRTSVTNTPPRYQEDYLIAMKQLASLKKIGYPTTPTQSFSRACFQILPLLFILTVLVFCSMW